MNRNIPEIPQKLLNKILALDQDEVIFLKNININTQLTTAVEDKLLDLNNKLGNDTQAISLILQKLSLQDIQNIQNSNINRGPPEFLTLYIKKIFVLLGLIIALYGFFVSYHLLVDNKNASYKYVIPLILFLVAVIYSVKFILEL